MDKVYIKKYSESLRKTVVAEYEAGASVTSLRKRYGIGGAETIQKWIKRYGRVGFRHEVVTIQHVEEREMAKRREEELEARIQELEAAVAQLTLDKLMLETILEVSSEMVGEDLKKKHAPKLSKRRITKDKRE